MKEFREIGIRDKSLNDAEILNYSIYPNPAKQQINIRTNSNNIVVCVYSLTGKKMIETSSKTIRKA